MLSSRCYIFSCYRLSPSFSKSVGMLNEMFHFWWFESGNLSDVSCYKCSSKVSFGDCLKNQTKIGCPRPLHYCTKMKYTTTEEDKLVTKYYKGCATVDQCKQANTNTMECCSEDLCNIGTKISYSLFIWMQHSKAQWVKRVYRIKNKSPVKIW